MDAYYNDFTKKKNAYSNQLVSLNRRMPVCHTQERKISASSNNTKRKTGSSAISLKSAIRSKIETIIDFILSLLDIIVETLSSSKTLTLIRTSVSVICLFTVIGIIGGIESGAVSWPTGIIVSVIAAAAEVICIRKCK